MADVRWSKRALADIDDIAAYIRMLNPEAATQTERRLKTLGNGLGDFPGRGRPATHGARDMVTVRPYIMRYKVIRNTVLILRVRHSARRPLA